MTEPTTRGTVGVPRRAASAALPTSFGDFVVHAYEGTGEAHHAAITLGDLADGEPPLVRVHSSCRTGDIFGSLRCDCGPQLRTALEAIAAEGRGVVVYLDQEGRGSGLPNKIRAYALQDRGLDTVDANLALGLEADRRDYRCAATILEDLDVRRVRLLTNNPRKVDDLVRHGVTVVDRIPLLPQPNEHNVAYLRTKADRLDHDIPRTSVASALDRTAAGLDAAGGPAEGS